MIGLASPFHIIVSGQESRCLVNSRLTHCLNEFRCVNDEQQGSENVSLESEDASYRSFDDWTPKDC
jgi:hypothetical protein